MRRVYKKRNFLIDYQFIEDLIKEKGFESVSDWCRLNNISIQAYYTSRNKPETMSLWRLVEYAEILDVALDEIVIFGDALERIRNDK